ncbi:hypothetical protein [Nocardia africana]|uniref:hypothetical protein n=1 Tax=Nocardia africana TaxID=134964 RepID=UPI000FE227CB|nr:hypothetical protein [Nocardia africana]MCC3318401.1 hypothetical protein [Nocardia africana]
MAGVVDLVNETAERLEAMPSDVTAPMALAYAHTGFGALTLAAAVLSGQASSARASELAAINLAVVAAHEDIAAVVDEQLLDDVIDTRVIELLEDAESLPRIRASARYLREAAMRTVTATRAVLTDLAAAQGISAPLREAIAEAGSIVDDIHILLDGPAHLRSALAEDYYERVIVQSGE